ncbi:MAG: ABC transporter permease [Candidatus Zixiibacteriota bacterium]
MTFESYIARRYFRSGRFFTNVSTWITIIGVMLGVAVVCFVMSMHNGFEREVRTRLLGTTSHISIFPTQDAFISHYRELIDTLEKIPGVVAASPFIYYKAAISSASEGDGIIVRGIDPAAEQRTANIERDITSGVYSFAPKVIDGDTIAGIILGSDLAERLAVGLDDPVVLYSLRGDELRSNSRPRIAKFYLAGTFETGMYEFDSQLAYISLASAQHLFKTGDAVNTVHLKLQDIYLANKLTGVIDSVLGRRYDVVPWNILHKNLFTWIAIEKKILFLGFILIVIVAAFSIISTLVMMTMEKRTEIGILKTLGATPSAVRRIFVYKGLLIAAGGVLGGWILALGGAFLQNRYKLVSLPADIYFISYVPIDAHLIDFLVAGALTVLICYLAALYPALQAARISVVEVLRS